MVVSSVSVTSRPGTGRWSCTVSSACPIGSCTTTSRPGVPSSTLLYCCSIPARPAPSGRPGPGTLVYPSTCGASPWNGYQRVSSVTVEMPGRCWAMIRAAISGWSWRSIPPPPRLQLILDRLHVVRPRGVRPVLLLLVMLGVVALLELVEAEGAGDDHGGVVRVREPSLVRDDRLRRLLLGQVLAVGAQDRPAQARQPPDVALLRDGLLRERGRVDDLDLRRPEHDDGERRQRERQHKPQPAVRHPRHGAARPPDDLVESRTCFVESAFAGTIP